MEKATVLLANVTSEEDYSLLHENADYVDIERVLNERKKEDGEDGEVCDAGMDLNNDDTKRDCKISFIKNVICGIPMFIIIWNFFVGVAKKVKGMNPLEKVMFEIDICNMPKEKLLCVFSVVE